MKKLMLVPLLSLACVNSASANIAWWDFLAELSGPGPWGSTPIQGRLWCADTPLKKCVVDDTAIKKMVVLSVTHGNTLRGDPFSMAGGDVTFMWRIHPLVDVGAGAGMVTFYRPGFTLNEAILVPASVTVTPLAMFTPKLRFLKVKFDEIYLTKGFRGEGWDTGSEFRPRVGLVIDVPAIFR